MPKKVKHSGQADRSFVRRSERKLAKLRNGATDPQTGKQMDTLVMDGDSSQIRRRAPVVEEGIKLLKPKPDDEVYEASIKKRVRYAAMRVHMERAAVVLAAGGTRKMAARKAGVSLRQIQKYYANADFRERIAELQETLGNKIRGKVIKEVDRRTNPDMIKKMELLDLLRVGDRFGLGRGKDSAINVNVEQHNYEGIFNEVFLNGAPGDNPEQAFDGGEESEDFPAFEPTSLALSGGDSPVDG